MELIKLAGILMILAASAWAGLRAALCLRGTREQLQELCAALELMAGEVDYAATAFVPLCRRAGTGRCAAVRGFFDALARMASEPDAPAEGRTRLACAEAGLLLPEQSVSALARLFDGYGRFDRAGQLRQLALATEELRRLSSELSVGMDGRCRSYRMLGLTAGAAILVLVL